MELTTPLLDVPVLESGRALWGAKILTRGGGDAELNTAPARSSAQDATYSPRRLGRGRAHEFYVQAVPDTNRADDGFGDPCVVDADGKGGTSRGSHVAVVHPVLANGTYTLTIPAPAS